jgi:hypothetical protein
MSRFMRHAPYFPVKDVAQSASDYDRCFGFTTEYAGGTPPEFAIVSRNGLATMLRRVSDASNSPYATATGTSSASARSLRAARASSPVR